MYSTRSFLGVVTSYKLSYHTAAILGRTFPWRVEDPSTRKDTRRRNNFSLGNLHAKVKVRVVLK